MRKLALILAALVAAFFVGFVAHTPDTQPTCPTEDSCHVDYHDGAWHIIEGE